MTNFENFKGKNKAEFIEANCFDLDVQKLPKFNIYMYDGNHTQDSHRRALTHFIGALDEVFIFVVDDWNWDAVRSGTYQALKDLKIEVLFAHEIRHTWDNSHTPGEIARNEYWNGIWTGVCRKPHT